MYEEADALLEDGEMEIVDENLEAIGGVAFLKKIY